MIASEADVKAKVKEAIDDLKTKTSIYTMCPMTFGFGESGHPDRLLLINGLLIGIECKYTGNTSLLKGSKPKSGSEARQKIRLYEIYKAGGLPCVVHRDNLDRFIELLEIISGCSITIT